MCLVFFGFVILSSWIVNDFERLELFIFYDLRELVYWFFNIFFKMKMHFIHQCLAHDLIIWVLLWMIWQESKGRGNVSIIVIWHQLRNNLNHTIAQWMRPRKVKCMILCFISVGPRTWLVKFSPSFPNCVIACWNFFLF